MVKALKYLSKGLLFLIGGPVVVLSFHSLVLCPVYHYPGPQPFSGDVWYNPYDGMDPDQWKLGNFQVQSLAWGGVTNGSNNPASRVFNVYDSLGYEVITISDYMAINPYTTADRPLIPVYEHGYGLFKTHQVLIGATEVLALDYPFFQTRNNKQHIVDRLLRENPVVCLAHPSLRNAYSHSDMAHLTGYRLVEAVSRFKMSLSHWDAALSAGKAVFVLSNDDAHDLDNPYDYGRCATMMNASGIDTESVLQALTTGNAYGYVPHCPDNVNHENKRKKFAERTHLEAFSLSDEMLEVEASAPLRLARFIGQGGDTLSVVLPDAGVHSASYRIQSADTYVRTELELENGDVFYLNPVFRTADGLLPAEGIPTISWAQTFIIRSGLLLLFVVPVVFWRRNRHKRKTHRATPDHPSMPDLPGRSPASGLPA